MTIMMTNFLLIIMASIGFVAAQSCSYSNCTISITHADNSQSQIDLSHTRKRVVKKVEHGVNTQTSYFKICGTLKMHDFTFSNKCWGYKTCTIKNSRPAKPTAREGISEGAVSSDTFVVLL